MRPCFPSDTSELLCGPRLRDPDAPLRSDEEIARILRAESPQVSARNVRACLEYAADRLHVAKASRDNLGTLSRGWRRELLVRMVPQRGIVRPEHLERLALSRR